MVRLNEEALRRRLKAQFVRRAIETEAPLLAAPLHRYAVAESMSWADLARSLDCSVDDLNHIAACRPPRPDRFVADVEAIAREYVDPKRLLPLLRRLQSLAAFAEHTVESRGMATAPQDAMLLAARDHEEESESGHE